MNKYDFNDNFSYPYNAIFKDGIFTTEDQAIQELFFEYEFDPADYKFYRIDVVSNDDASLFHSFSAFSLGLEELQWIAQAVMLMGFRLAENRVTISFSVGFVPELPHRNSVEEYQELFKNVLVEYKGFSYENGCFVEPERSAFVNRAYKR